VTNIPYTFAALPLPNPNEIAELVAREITLSCGLDVSVMITDTDKTYSKGRIHITPRPRAANGIVEIAVIDRGSGIDPKNLDSIFNPFFTTKPDGVGLGLAIVSKIVDQHGGKIAVESDPGKGSVFRVFLPMERAVPALSA
jgi:signal transduction histidine kinase